MNVVFHITGMILGVWLTARRFRRQGLTPDVRFYVGFVGLILAGVAGTRLLYVISDLRYYVAHWQEIFSLEVTIIQGALVFGLPAMIVFARFLGLPFWKLADLAAPGLVLGQAIGRIGCLVQGCCYGLPVHLPGLETDVVWRYPTQIMHAGANLAIFFTLLVVEKRKLAPFEGFTTLLYFLLFSIQRLAIDYLRVTGVVFAPDMPFAGVRVARVVSVISIVLAGAVLAWKWKKSRTEKSS